MAVMFTGNNPSNALHSLQAIMTIPEIAWELFLGVYCTFRGFRPDAPILAASAYEHPTARARQQTLPGTAALG